MLFYGFDSWFVVFVDAVSDGGKFFISFFDLFENGVDGCENFVSVLVIL